jgi:uncharacterized membrane protein (DUF373 family)
MDMIDIIEKFEKAIYAVLMVMLMGVLLVTLVDLVLLLFGSLKTFDAAYLSPAELTTVFGAFLLVLIGVELLDTLKVYFRENAIHVEIVVLLAIIAVARKVLLLDPTASHMNGIEYGFELMGIGVIVVGLAAAYYLIKKAGFTVGPNGIGKRAEKE